MGTQFEQASIIFAVRRYVAMKTECKSE